MEWLWLKSQMIIKIDGVDNDKMKSEWKMEKNGTKISSDLATDAWTKRD